MASVTKDLGRVMPVAQGAYSTTKTYVPLDIVTYNGSSYICLATNTGKAPTDMTCWQSLAMRGSDGPTGPAGKDGATGAKGDTGAQGPQGLQGIQGPKGDTGPQGPKGDTGPQGATGQIGPQGPKGDQGSQGERGKQIFKSSYEDIPHQATNYWSDLSPAVSVNNPPQIGDTVITPAGNIFQIDTVNVGGGGGGGTFGVGDVLGNIKGPAGATGATGATGPQGIQGPKGDTGPQGIQGPKGDTGPQGIQGPKGDTGPQGPQGPAGKDAVSQILDTQSTNQLPGWYHTNNPKKVVTEFKQTAAIGITQALMPSGQTLGTYCSLTTETPWSDSSGGSVFQTAKLINQTRPVVLIRVGTSDTAWSAWELMTTW